MTTIGIDLGTTNSAVSVWQDDEITLIPNSLGEVLTPSVVGMNDEKQIIVGRTARERLLTHPDKTVGVFKRLMGTKHEIRLGNKKYTAQELASFVLRSLKKDAEAHLESPIEEAVISVPAYFNDHQRQATKLAGELAGLKIRRLINEPTAAALAYGLHEKKHGTFMVLDMGGGTFDVSILEYFDGIMEVHASAGDNFLGGEDFVDEMVASVLQQHKLKKDAIGSGDLQKLSFKLERFKQGLDESDSENITYQIGKKQFEWHATKEWFDGIATPLLLRARRPIEKALSDAALQPQEIDEMLLVGGATKLRNFREFVARTFKRLPSVSIDPDTVVCVGAGIQAALVTKNESLSEVVLTDVCPYTLGTEVNGPGGVGQFFPIIERNATVPLSIAHTFYTASDNQRWVELGVYQGENRLVEKNILLANLSIPVPRGPKGKEAIEVRYSYDVNGLLEVDATVISNGKVFNKVVENTSGGLSESEIAASRKKLSKLKYHPREDELNRSLIAKGERLYEMNLGEKREFVGNTIAKFEAILDRQNEMEIKKAQIALKDLLDELDQEDWV